VDTSDQREPIDTTLTSGSSGVGGPPILDESPLVPDGPPHADESPSNDRPRRTLPTVPWSRLLRVGAKLGIVALLVVVASVALGGAAFVAAGFYGQYGAVKNGPNAQAWAALSPRMAGSPACASCHEPQIQAQDASVHVDVSCESCHGPAATHALSDAAARETDLEAPTSAACITCHATTPGRPAGFAQVDPVRHFRGGDCLRCHDPHSVTAVRPPTVTHPLAKLPACTACHAPDGLKEIPTGHEPAADAVCLSCHGKTADGLPD